jgi:hypothetical protein
VLQAADSLPGGVLGAVGKLTDFLLGYAVALAAVGALAMALIEAWKKLRDSRTRYHAKRWVHWVKSISLAHNVPDQHRAQITPVGVLTDMLQLCTGISREAAAAAARILDESDGALRRAGLTRADPALAVFALDLERMMGSVQDAADVALNNPSTYAALYHCLTTGADSADVQAWYREAHAGLESIANTEPTPEQRKQVKLLADRYARLRQVVKRRLDGFQLYTSQDWTSWNQLAANVVGIVLLAGILVWMQVGDLAGAPGWAPILPLSLLGGILSPIAKDLVTALKRVKDG